MKKIIAMFFAASIMSACAFAPSTFVRNQPGWSVIELADGVSKDSAWGKVADALKERDLEFDKIDKDAGYMRTAWNYRLSNKNNQTYATRVIVDFPTNGKTIKVKTQAQFLNDGRWEEGFDVNYQSTFKEEIASVIGRK